MPEIVVMFTPPHYKVQGVAKIWMGRIDRAIDVAIQKHCPLIVAGDANGGQDLDTFVIRAHRSCVPAVIRAFNGDDRSLKNTRGDARAIVRVMSEIPAMAYVDQITIVTCWYHMLRCWIALRQALGNRRVRIACAPVWTKFWHGVTVLPNELRGCLDYLFGRSQKSRGKPIGKPDLGS
ncbi:MAG: ElyC/SanA/YdcF family protein [Patescibacteria group bacterium]